MKLPPLRALLLLALLLAGRSVYGADSSQVLGSWKLMSYLREDVVTGKTDRPWGESPGGYLVYLPDGHMIGIITSEGRKPVAVSDEKFNEKNAQLLFNMVAYAGTYSVEGAKVIHHVEVAWLPSWVGSEQPREIAIDGNMLTMRTQPIRSARDGKDYIYLLVWKRAVAE